MFRKYACNMWVINSILGRIYRRFRLFLPFPYIIYDHLKRVIRFRATLYIYEGELTENLKSVIKIRTTAQLSCKFQQ